MNDRKTVLLLMIAGCADPARSQELPGVDLDQTGGVVAQLVSENIRPCGYSHTDDYPALPGTPEQISHFIGRITYNDRGDVVLDVATNDTDGSSYRYAVEYNPMGQPTSYAYDYSYTPSNRLALTYDSFGHLVQYANQDDGNGTGNWVSTYTYGDDGNRLTAHHVDTRAVRSYDRTYSYDDHGRLSGDMRDNGPDGVVDQIDQYVYDDVKRVITLTTTSPSGDVLGSDTWHYDADNHVVLEDYVQNRTTDTLHITYTNTYQGGRLLSGLSSTLEVTPGLDDYTSTSRDDYQYDGCK